MINLNEEILLAVKPNYSHEDRQARTHGSFLRDVENRFLPSNMITG